MYTDILHYLKDIDVGFPADLADFVGDEFLKHLNYTRVVSFELIRLEIT